ncbi:MAG: hypothetical protein R3Y56_05070 [Akkermansia sp.]
MNTFSLIIPVAAPAKDRMPHEFMLDEEGSMYCVKAILGLNLDAFQALYFTILREHDEKYFIAENLAIQFRKHKIDKAQVVILDQATNSQVETVHQCIEQMGIEGAIFIKDADGYFEANISPHNCIVTYSLEQMEFVKPKLKCYVDIDDFDNVINIIEKRIVGHTFGCGGYGFEEAAEFCHLYQSIKNYQNLYVSHIIFAALLKKTPYRAIHAQNYIDWSTHPIQALYHAPN